MYIREDQIVPHLAALAMLLACQEHAQAHRYQATSQITAPARAAELIDRLRCSATAGCGPGRRGSGMVALMPRLRRWERIELLE